MKSSNYILCIVLNWQLTEQLNVIGDVTQSEKYEEFLANVSRRYIDNCVEVLREEILEHAQTRANELRERWTKLRTKYNELDALLSEKFNLPSSKKDFLFFLIFFFLLNFQRQ